jgi:hypothetical protein
MCPGVCIPNRSSKSATRKHEQKKRWFRNGQRWRTGCDARISVSKRRTGPNRCRCGGEDGIQRWASSQMYWHFSFPVVEYVLRNFLHEIVNIYMLRQGVIRVPEAASLRAQHKQRPPRCRTGQADFYR